MTQTLLTPEEVAALLQGLNQAKTGSRPGPKPAARGPGRSQARVLAERDSGRGAQKISQPRPSLRELPWPQL